MSLQSGTNKSLPLQSGALHEASKAVAFTLYDLSCAWGWFCTVLHTTMS
jgi:hypothetical protein